MNRKEKILQCVRQMVDEQETKTGIDSGTIAEALGLERSNVSRDLNELVREGLVVKSESRPVLFWLDRLGREKQHLQKRCMSMRHNRG